MSIIIYNRLDVDTRHTMTSNGQQKPTMEVTIILLLLLAGWTQQSSKILNLTIYNTNGTTVIPFV
jgi:hypothetical protein